MEGVLPSPTLRLFGRETSIFMPTFAKELVRTIRQIAPRECRDGINHLPKFGLRLLDFGKRVSEGFLRLLAFTLRSFSVLDVERGRIPSFYPSLIIEQWIVANKEPAIFAVLTQRALLILEL